MAVYIGWSSIHDDATVSGGNQDAYGGMDNTFDAYNGWNWHMWCMTLAVPVCMVESFLLAWHSPRLFDGPNRKWVHLGLQTAGMGFMITGLIAIVQSKQNTADQLQTAADYEAAKSIAAGGSPRVMDTQPVMMWSVHSWVSTATLLVYVLQYFSGLTIFVFYRKSMTAQNMAYFSARHRLLGKMTVFALLGCCMLFPEAHVAVSPSLLGSRDSNQKRPPETRTQPHASNISHNNASASSTPLPDPSHPNSSTPSTATPGLNAPTRSTLPSALRTTTLKSLSAHKFSSLNARSPDNPRDSGVPCPVLFREYLSMAQRQQQQQQVPPPGFDPPRGVSSKLFVFLCRPSPNLLDFRDAVKRTAAVLAFASRMVLLVPFLVIPLWLLLVRTLFVADHHAAAASTLIFGAALLYLADASATAQGELRALRCAEVFTSSDAADRLQTLPPPPAHPTSTAVPTSTASAAATARSATAAAAAPAVASGAASTQASVAAAKRADGSAAAAAQQQQQPAASRAPVAAADPKLVATKSKVIKLENALFGNELSAGDLGRDVIQQRVSRLCEEVGITFNYSPAQGYDSLLWHLRGVEEALGVE
ncbi:MAG: hypothetical protein WDW36_009783 [Sanguina aurantia]